MVLKGICSDISLPPKFYFLPSGSEQVGRQSGVALFGIFLFRVHGPADIGGLALSCQVRLGFQERLQG
jgi:hypothetical protein